MGHHTQPQAQLDPLTYQITRERKQACSKIIRSQREQEKLQHFFSPIADRLNQRLPTQTYRINLNYACPLALIFTRMVCAGLRELKTSTRRKRMQMATLLDRKHTEFSAPFQGEWRS
jgi:hypothetical protein